MVVRICGEWWDFLYVNKKNCHIVILILNIESFSLFHNFLETDGRRVAFPCTKEYTYVSVSEFTYTVVT